MDNNVVRTLNQGPMGPQGPVKVNNCIMNDAAGFEPVVRIYPHKWPQSTDVSGSDIEDTDDDNEGDSSGDDLDPQAGGDDDPSENPLDEND